MHLAGMYTEKEWDDQALSAYYAIYAQGLLDKDSEIVMLSQRLLNAEVPFEAASVLEAGIDADIVEQNEKNLRLWPLVTHLLKKCPKPSRHGGGRVSLLKTAIFSIDWPRH